MRFAQAATRDGAAARFAENERLVARGFWAKLRRFAARLPFAEPLVAAYYCAFDRETPLKVRVTLVGALAYFVSPFDAVPDWLPAIGFTDDAAVLMAAIKLVADHMRPEHYAAAREKLAQLR